MKQTALLILLVFATIAIQAGCRATGRRRGIRRNPQAVPTRMNASDTDLLPAVPAPPTIDA